MADGSAASLKTRVSEAEWQTRVELAALYRLVALNGWDDMIFTHISARVPGPELSGFFSASTGFETASRRADQG